MRVSSSIVAGLASVAFVVLSSAYISMQCWPAQIGCHHPSVVGWLDYLNLVLTISLGPLAPVYILAVFSPGKFAEAGVSNTIFLLTCIIVAILPWYMYVKRKSYFALFIANILWVFFGFMFGVAVFT